MVKNVKEKVSIAEEIDNVEKRLSVCRKSLEGMEFRLRKEELLEDKRLSLEEEKSLLLERISKYEHQLRCLRGENRRNMLLSVAILTLFVLLYSFWINS
ncbi:coiled-coil domain-containing protein 167 [Erpetoichthys calabaricus]|uniref:Coiled-coil domain-containing protein 167 n=1 Tax=Erpetoichthys calabaricus TaxID=27687 RepID=A0A8C4T4J7_ERPCA|nr:coiled-coil domain-containing protein 167 [Erpetoichthys calabaricus]